MAKIIGNTTATPNPRPDWNQTDDKKADYIKNKPIVDQEYSPESANAQSGKAVAKALQSVYDSLNESHNMDQFPIINTEDLNTTFDGVYKCGDYGYQDLIIAWSRLYTYDTDGDDEDDGVDFYAHQMRITYYGDIFMRSIIYEANDLPEDGFSYEDMKGLWEEWTQVSNKPSVFERKFNITYAGVCWPVQPPEMVDTSIFSTEEIYRICRYNTAGGDISGKFRLMKDYNGQANPIKDARGNIIEFTLDNNIPSHNTIVSFNNIRGTYKFFTPDCSVRLYLHPGYTYDIYTVADVRGDTGGGTVIQHILASDEKALLINGGSTANITSSNVELMTGSTPKSNYTTLFNHTQLTYSKGLIACTSNYKYVAKDSASASSGNGTSSFYSSCALAIDCEFDTATFDIMLHPTKSGVDAQHRGVFFKGTQIFVTGRKFDDQA